MIIAWIAAAAAQAGPAWTPQEAQVIAALSVRHDPPTCAALVERTRAAGADPAATLVHVAEQYDALPWVGMRAAACATQEPSAWPALRRWVVDPDNAGLADVALRALPKLPPSEAAALTQLALAGPHRDLAARRLSP